MSLSKAATALGKASVILRDVNAVQRGRAPQRIANRIMGRLVSRLMRKLWR